MFTGVNIDSINTKKYIICCIKPPNCKCSEPIPWYVSCKKLFPNTAMRVLFIIISLCVMASNCSLLLVNINKIVQHYRQSKSKRKKNKIASAYNIIINLINIGDLMCGIYLTIVWSADVYYNEVFVVREEQWKENSICMIAFSVTHFFSIFLPFCLIYLSMSRLMIIKYPFDSKFKSTKFTVKCSLALFMTICLLCISLNTVYLHFNRIPTGLCLPFIDPTDSLWEIKVITIVIIWIQLFAIISIIVIHCLMIKELNESKKSLGKENNLNRGMMIQLFILTGSNIVCWLPSSIIYLSSIFLTKYPTEMLIWTTVTIMPFNSIINPVVFLVLMIKKK
jgi:leucine-rich repeat-containing G protein-coupled receptor 8